MLLSYSQITDIQPNIIEGKFVSQQTNLPLSNVHVNILYDDEGVTSTSNGSFVLRLWQAFPVTLVVEHKAFKTQLIKVQSASKDFIISLHPKA